MKRPSSIILLRYVAQILLFLGSVVARDGPKIFTSDPTVVTSIVRGKIGNRPVKLTEYYSDNLGRGVVQSDGTVLYADRQIEGVIVEPTVQGYTNRVIRENQPWHLLLQNLWANQELQNLLDIDDTYHVIGLSKLLVLIENRRAELKPSPENPTTRKILQVNIGTDELVRILKLDIDYSNVADKESNSMVDKFPNSIDIFSDKNVKLYTVEYRVWPQFDTDDLMQYKDSNRIFKALDIFTFPVGYNISWNLRPYRIETELPTRWSRKFSFEAQTYLSGVKQSPQIVAVDLMSGTIRTRDEKTDMVLDIKSNVQQLVARDRSAELVYSSHSCQLLAFTLAYDKNSNFIDLMFGNSSFAYMGDAVVRGAKARVFEASIRTIPIWLDLWTQIVNQDKEPFRHGRSKFSYNQTPMNIVLYVRHNGNAELDLVMSAIVLIEIYIPYRMNERLLIYQSEIYNHVHGVSELADQGRASDFFALPECYSHESSLTDTVNAELLFKYSYSDQTILQSMILHRDAALISALSDKLQVPASIFMDLESSVSKSDNNGIYLNVNMRLGIKVPNLKQLKYIGNGRESDIQRSDGIVFWKGARTPSECLALFDQNANGRTMYLYYSRDNKMCLIDQSIKTVEGMKRSKLAAYYIEPDDFGDIYEVTNDTTHQLNYILSTVRETITKMKSPIIVELSVDGTRFEFEIVDRKILTDDSSISDAINFHGLKLSLSDGNEDVKKYVRLNKSTFNIDECEIGCLEDLNCQTYSYCKSDDIGDTICLMSPKSLSSNTSLPTIQNQIKQSGIMSKDRGTIVTINSSSGGIVLERDRTCSIHQKHHLHMFSYNNILSINLGNKQVVRVEDIHECAARCLERNLAALKQLNSLDANITEFLESISSEGSLEIDASFDELKQFESERASVTKGLCDEFYYMDETFMTHETKTIDESMRKLDGDDPDLGRGFCIVNNTFKPTKDKQAVWSKFEKFRFNYDSLFEKNHDIMMGSNLNSEQVHIFEQASSGSKLTQSDLATMAKLIADGKNHQKVTGKYDSKDCARRCFRQVRSVWPACRSFDINQIDNQCALNSATKNSTDTIYIEHAASSGRQAVESIHYELKFGLSKFDNDALYKLELEKESLWSNYVEETRSHWLIKFWLIILGVGTGIIAGIKLVRPVARYLNLSDGLGISDLTSIPIPPPLQH